MINLKNGYGITSDGKSYTLIQYAIQTSKNGEEKEIQKSISFHSTLESALQGYSNCRMEDLVSDYDMDLKFVKEAINELACGKAMIEETARAKVYFEFLADLADKETPKKPVVIQDDIFGDYHLVCPNCEEGGIIIATRTDGKLYLRCPFCGQKLKGDDEDDC